MNMHFVFRNPTVFCPRFVSSLVSDDEIQSRCIWFFGFVVPSNSMISAWLLRKHTAISVSFSEEFMTLMLTWNTCVLVIGGETPTDTLKIEINWRVLQNRIKAVDMKEDELYWYESVRGLVWGFLWTRGAWAIYSKVHETCCWINAAVGPNTALN